MAKPQTELQAALVIKRQFDAPREKVFKAWTDPQALMQWFHPSDDFKTPVAQTDPRVGGQYRVEMVSPEGKRYCLVGRYQEVKPPERLVFTWAWEHDEMDTGDTLVTIELHDLGGRTELILTHERFRTALSREKHEHGHSGCLEQLRRYLA